MSNGNPNPGPCNPPAGLKGVLIVYDDDQGNQQCEWVNLKAVNGITWCPGDPPARPKTPPKKPLPTTPNGPDLDKCSSPPAQADRNDDVPLCWWTGSNWECGQA